MPRNSAGRTNLPKRANEVANFVSDVIFGICVHVIHILFIARKNRKSFDECGAVLEHEESRVFTRIQT